MVGHCLKNEQTQLAQAVSTLNAEYRLLLTGTPLQKLPSQMNELTI
jgi:SNF2 family DNA or RNA helicase